MFSSIILGAAIISGFSYIAYQVANFSFLTTFSKRWLLKQIIPIREEMKKRNVELIKIPVDSWNELSMGYERLNSKFTLKGIEVGVVKSIYFENLMLVGKKNQLSASGKFVMVVFVDDIEVILIGTSKEVRIFINEADIGVINKSRLSYQSSTGVKAIIKPDATGEYNYLEVNHKKTCILLANKPVKNPFNTRMIVSIDKDCQEEFVRAMPLIIYYIMKDK